MDFTPGNKSLTQSSAGLPRGPGEYKREGAVERLCLRSVLIPKVQREREWSILNTLVPFVQGSFFSYHHCTLPNAALASTHTQTFIPRQELACNFFFFSLHPACRSRIPNTLLGWLFFSFVHHGENFCLSVAISSLTSFPYCLADVS